MRQFPPECAVSAIATAAEVNAWDPCHHLVTLGFGVAALPRGKIVAQKDALLRLAQLSQGLVGRVRNIVGVVPLQNQAPAAVEALLNFGNYLALFFCSINCVSAVLRKCSFCLSGLRFAL